MSNGRWNAWQLPLPVVCGKWNCLVGMYEHRPKSWSSSAPPSPSLFGFLSQQSSVIFIILPITLIKRIIAERTSFTSGRFRFKVSTSDNIHISASFAMFNQCAVRACSPVIIAVKPCTYIVCPLLGLPLRPKFPRKPSCFSVRICDAHRSNKIFCTFSGTASHSSTCFSHNTIFYINI